MYSTQHNKCTSCWVFSAFINSQGLYGKSQPICSTPLPLANFAATGRFFRGWNVQRHVGRWIFFRQTSHQNSTQRHQTIRDGNCRHVQDLSGYSAVAVHTRPAFFSRKKAKSGRPKGLKPLGSVSAGPYKHQDDSVVHNWKSDGALPPLFHPKRLGLCRPKTSGRGHQHAKGLSIFMSWYFPLSPPSSRTFRFPVLD